MKKIALTSALVLLAAQTVQAQQTPRWSITPILGSYVPTVNLGSVSGANPETDSDVGLRTDASPLFGVSVERATPDSRLAVRTQFLFAPSTGAVAQRHVGEESCGENCFRMLYDRETLASGSTAMGTLDLVFRPAESWRVRPYVAVGAGLRRYDVDDSELEPAFAAAFTQDRTSVVGHVGLGAAVRAHRAEIRVEVGDYFGRHRVGDPSTSLAHELSTTLGLVIPLP